MMMTTGGAIGAPPVTATGDQEPGPAMVILNRGAGSERLEHELTGRGWRVQVADVPAGDPAGCAGRVSDVLAAPGSPDQAVLLGYGDVGRAALEIAGRHPERVAAVVAVDSARGTGQGEVRVADLYGPALTLSADVPSTLTERIVSFLGELTRPSGGRRDRPELSPSRLPALTPALLNDPVLIGRLRETGPVHRINVAGVAPSWILTGHRATTALADPGPAAGVAITAGFRLQSPAIPHEGERDLVTIDGREHARLRRMIGRYLTPRRVRALGPRIQREADALLAVPRRHEAIDLVAAFALPLPVIVLCELLGVPRRDRGYIHEWLVDRMRAHPGDAHHDVDDYLRALIRTRKGHASDDLFGWVLAGEADRPAEDDLVAAARLLMTAGHRAPATLLANGTAALLRHRDQWTRLTQDPELIVPAVEELLRYVTPFPVGLPRYAATSIEIDGTLVPEGELVAASLVAANRDPRVFDEPDVLDIGRPANPHLAFGQGRHHCLGAALARAQARIAIGTLARRFPDMDLARDARPPRQRQGRVRYLLELPVILDPRPGPRPEA
ncbi:cytochrome P450 [Sphaerisporangium sp. NPDC051011]|uniref:cytochrome P450 n=1 Tax=Sphaerisporangium sp. NPDC051011 TaxID=3155792 RepID=UPI0033FA585F